MVEHVIIMIIQVESVAAKDCRRANIQQLHNSQIRFPLPRKIMSRKAQNAPRFTTARPNTMDVWRVCWALTFL